MAIRRSRPDSTNRTADRALHALLERNTGPSPSHERRRLHDIMIDMALEDLRSDLVLLAPRLCVSDRDRFLIEAADAFDEALRGGGK